MKKDSTASIINNNRRRALVTKLTNNKQQQQPQSSSTNIPLMPSIIAMSPSRNFRQAVTKALDISHPTTPRENDVFLFRGGETNNHKGSKNWREMIKDHLMEYISANSNGKKRDIIEKCIQIHKDRGGRYVGKHKGQYYLATRDKMYQKTAQKLRDYAKEYLDSITPISVVPYPQSFSEATPPPMRVRSTAGGQEESLGLSSRIRSRVDLGRVTTSVVAAAAPPQAVTAGMAYIAAKEGARDAKRHLGSDSKMARRHQDEEEDHNKLPSSPPDLKGSSGDQQQEVLADAKRSSTGVTATSVAVSVPSRTNEECRQRGETAFYYSAHHLSKFPSKQGVVAAKHVSATTKMSSTENGHMSSEPKEGDTLTTDDDESSTPGLDLSYLDDTDFLESVLGEDYQFLSQMTCEHFA